MEQNQEEEWFVLRDLKRPNASIKAYQELADLGFKVYTPMKTLIQEKRGRKVKLSVPFINDLLFVYSSRQKLDPIVLSIPTLQYRFIKGGKFGDALKIRKSDMENFIKAVESSEQPVYLSPSELRTSMIGKRIKVISKGPLDGREGKLLKIEGSRKKRLLIELPGVLFAGIEIRSADYVELKDTN